MENKKSNKGVIVTLIILIIMVLALGSYIVYVSSLIQKMIKR